MEERVGRVKVVTLDAGSRSERSAAILVTDDEEVELRMPQGHTYDEPRLRALEHRVVRCKGFLSGRVFFLEEWTEIDDA